MKISTEIFAKTLQEIYESPDEKLKVDYGKIKDIPYFEIDEMKKRLVKCEILGVQTNPMWWSK